MQDGLEEGAFSSVVIPDGSIVLMGGDADYGSTTMTYGGQQIKAQRGSTSNESAGWSGRNTHSSVLMPDGSIVLMGGGDNSGSILRMTYGGQQIKVQPGPEVNRTCRVGSGRDAHSSVVMPDSSIVLMGGT